MHRPIHFEFPADDPNRAIKFYGDVFGWTFKSWGEGPQTYWLITTGDKSQPGIDGGMMPRHPGMGNVNVMDVASCDDATAKITKAGGKNVVPKMAVPGVGWVAYFNDTEGNMFGIIQMDQGAK